MTITERMFIILKDKKLSQKDFSAYIDVNEKTVSAWKKNNSLPPADKLEIISNYLDVSLEYLITGKEKSSFSEFSDNELEMILLFKCLNLTQQGKIIERTKMMHEAEEEKDAVLKEKVS